MARTLTLGTILIAALAGAAGAQTPTPTPTTTTTPTPIPTPSTPTTLASGVTYATEGPARVNGVRLRVQPDGSVWFLEAGADRISVLRDGTITYWQLRENTELGANPVDFEIDGDTIWFIGSGESLIPAGTCTFSSLNTTTGALTEWVIPGSIPGAFYRAPDGKVWLPQSQGLLQSFDPATLQVINYRSPQTFAYADMKVGADGALWLADFGNNRIVRWEPGAATETAWTIADPAAGRLNPAEIQFDDEGFLWISEFSAGSLDRFDPATGEVLSYFGLISPLHFVRFQNRFYITSAQSLSAVMVLDPDLASPFSRVVTPQTNAVASLASTTPVTIRTSTITPTTFASAPTPIVNTDLVIDATTLGVLTTTVTAGSTNTYGIAVSGGSVWFGTDQNVTNVILQTVGGPTDQVAPVATGLAGTADAKIRIDLTLHNRGSTAIAGDALYLYSSGAFGAFAPFTLAAGETKFLQDAFGNLGSPAQVTTGPVRFRVNTGTATDLVATVRSARVRPDGATFGYAILPERVSSGLAAGTTTTLFTGSRDSEISILGIYAPTAATGTLALLSPDGTIRGTRAFNLVMNAVEEFNPAASGFGVAPEPGDVVRVAVLTGNLQAYVNVLDAGTGDVATSLPAVSTTDAVAPNVGELVGIGGIGFVSDLFLSNPDPQKTAHAFVTLYGLGSTEPPAVAPVALAPQESRAITEVLPTLFGANGQGTLLITSDVPIASAVRIATRISAGDYAAFASTIGRGDAVPDGGSSIAIGLPQTATRRTNLLLYNRGLPGNVTVTGFKPDGTEAGHVSIPLGNHQPGRLDAVFAAFGITDQPAGRIRIDAPAGMMVYGWTAEVDGFTGDVDIAPLR